MTKIISFVLFLVACCLSAWAKAPGLQTLFYTTGYSPSYYTAASWQSLKQHHRLVNYIAPQAFQLDEHGFVWGKVDPKIVALARRDPKLQMMPLVVNSQFKQSIAHSLLHNEEAQLRAISHLIALAKQFHFNGWQLDLENISYRDRAALGQFYQRAAKAIHKAGLKVSIAIVPHLSDFQHPRVSSNAT